MRKSTCLLLLRCFSGERCSHLLQVQAYLDFLRQQLSESKDAELFAKKSLSVNDFVIDPKPLGEGAAGKVYKARLKDGDGRVYALKRFEADTMADQMARREAEKARVPQLQTSEPIVKNQSFIVPLLAVVDDPDNKCSGKALVYELCDGSVSALVTEASLQGRYVPVCLLLWSCNHYLHLPCWKPKC